MDRSLSERMWVVRLIEAYGRLLTAHQQRILRLYYLDDLSLGEIAERLHVTRQAAADNRGSAGRAGAGHQPVGCTGRCQDAAPGHCRIGGSAAGDQVAGGGAHE